ncbi:MAG: hypothetical protein A2912_06205 [Candidatus Buchananbacteria bacterium RIFCSPLOWO2_01_FULL_40_23b]|uniref:Transcription regulator TrmB N-terminal domain-containing protein n=1 Tax=Candidatus Buchananbacteria bacterium RIFCSPLOWO2_01_FULL_40_23b TaxID=1797544 RepID=A0A1G1YWA3_9BACT|nr:MAG: hypothetical protein A2912_06205 [Candidatus Buchananbacteria bacterium RIFCSPLOWO2_01_FULL_40_23b]
MDETNLLKLGLNRNEAKVYVMLLQLGTASAGQLIKATEFHRNIVYDNLEKLADRGLVTFIIEGKKRLFRPAPPEMITQMFVKEQEELNQRKKVAETIKKEVEKITTQAREAQEATMFQGVNGLKVVFKDTLTEGKEYYVFGAPKSSLEIMGSTYWENYNLKRAERKIRIRMIFNDDLREWSYKIKSGLTKVRFLPKKFDSITETIIYGNKVAIIVWTQKPIATLIKDKHLAASYKQYFDLLWKQARD